MQLTIHELLILRGLAFGTEQAEIKINSRDDA